MRIVSYLRVSGQTQVEGDGFERQEASINKFCADLNLEIVRKFQEEGVSGTVEAVDRPAFSEMLAYIEAYDVDAIVVERMDRLARDLMVSEFLLRECRSRGIKVYAADQGALIDMASDGGDPTRKLIRQLMAALAEWEKSVLVKKLYEARKRTGNWGGEPLYGGNPNERSIVAFMRLQRQEGRSFGQIAQTLNDLGMVNRQGGKWARQNVHRVLSRLA
jgi:DNA invertase Pin-like site-specific DNA recombinase